MLGMLTVAEAVKKLPAVYETDVDISPLLGPFWNQINPLHTFLPYIFKTLLSLHLVQHVMYIIV
jgi:hypothetical protein